jgi:hypothetical protein
MTIAFLNGSQTLISAASSAAPSAPTFLIRTMKQEPPPQELHAVKERIAQYP